MKIRALTTQLSAGVALAFVTFTFNNGRAATATPQGAPEYSAPSSPFQYVVYWEEGKREKLRHAYYLLDHADGDYGGHREAAMKAIKAAAKEAGFELHWTEHGEEAQWKSDRRLHEAKHLLEDLVVPGDEQPRLHRAIKEIDKALATK